MEKSRTILSCLSSLFIVTARFTGQAMQQAVLKNISMDGHKDPESYRTMSSSRKTASRA